MRQSSLRFVLTLHGERMTEKATGSIKFRTVEEMFVEVDRLREEIIREARRLLPAETREES